MFSCFGFRARHKGLTSSGHSDVELRAPLTPKDGVPLNTHNHHHKYALYHYYNNSLHRSSLNSSRRNSQASTASVSEGPTTKGAKAEDRRKSLELPPQEHAREGLKITDLDNNTTDIIRCNDNLIAVLKEDKSKSKSGKKKNRKKFNTLPRNLALQSLEDDNNKNSIKLINVKNNLISELLNNNDFPKVNGIISVENVRVSTSNLLASNSSSKTNIPKLQSSTPDKATSAPKSPKAKLSKKEAKKQAKKQNLNRSLSPTDLDSFVAQTNGSCSPSIQETAKNYVPQFSSSSLKGSLPSLQDSSVSKTITPSAFPFEKTQAATTKSNFETPKSKILPKSSTAEVVQPMFQKPSKPSSKTLSDSKITTPTVIDCSSENCNASLTEIPTSIPRNCFTDNSTDTTISQKKVAVKPGPVKEEISSKTPLSKSGKTTPSKLPTTKNLTSKYGKTSSSSGVSGPSSYTRLPIALDRKPAKMNAAISSNGFLPLLQAPKAESEDLQSSSLNEHNSESAVIASTPISKILGTPLSLFDPNDSSIPLIDFDDAPDTFTPDATSEVRADMGASAPFVDKGGPLVVPHIPVPNNMNKQERDASVTLIDRNDTSNESPSIETLLVPDLSDSSLSADHLSQRHRVAFRRKKRKQSDNEPDDEQPVKTSRPSKGGPGALSAADTAELKRLEAELSAKSTEAEQAKKEADEAKSEATHAGRGLEALTVLVHHLTHQYEAFSNPVLKAEIARLQTCLQEAERALGESRVALEAAETRLSEERASAALQQLQIEEQHGTTLQRLQEEQEQHLQQIKDQHLKDMEDLAKEHQGDTLAEQEQHRAEVTRLEAEHERKLSEVCRVHGEEQQTLRRDLLALGDGQHQVSEVLATHATREQELQARSTSLQKEHDRLKEQSKKLQDSLLSDNDHRVTALKNYCTGLQQEVDSLKSVVEMRNSELHKLRAQVSGMEQLQRDLDAARQCANTLQAKTEDLNAQMDAKAKAERQLLSSNRQLLENMNRESTLNKQLRLENEQLQWKLRQREQLSTSLPLSTLDLMTRVCHLNTSWEERPASLHHQQHLLRESQQSAALGKGATRAESRLVTSSPQDDRSKQQQKDQTHQDKLKAQKRGDGESPPSSPCVKAVVEKSNSVSFILDLNDSLSDDSYLEFPASPRLKHGTPTFCRKAVQKSRSSSLDKKIGSQMGKNIALAKCTSAGNFFSKGPHSELEPIKDSKSESSKENGSFLSDNQLHEHSRRLHSTSESSGGADSETLESSIERVSPSGLAWTVPMNGTSPNSPRSPRHSSSRDNFTGIGLRHLQEPEEDEYEENLEDSEDAFINGIHPDITPLVNLMNASSSSPSDSELSRCGSQAGLTSESDEESSLAEGDRPADSLSPEAVWLPQVGAGESMVSSELVVQCGGSNSSTDSTGHSTKDTPTKDVQNKMALSTASFPNGEGAPQGRLEGEQKV